MIQYIAILLASFIAFIWYRYYYVPKKQINRYKSIFKDLGYTVYEQPFTFLGLGFLTDLSQCVKKYKDSHYTEKHVYSKVDIVVGNVLEKTAVIFVKPDLIRQFQSIDSLSNYQKHELLIRGLKQALGDGMLFSEGQSWKNKRRVISKVFNFDLLNENIPTIAKICDRWLEQFDRQRDVGEGKVKFSPLELSARIFNGVMMKCFFGCDQVKEKVRGQSFEEFTIQIMSNSGKLLKDPILVLFGRFAYKYGLTKSIREVKEDVKIFREIISQICSKRTQQVLKSEKTTRCTDILQALLYQKMTNKEEYSYSQEELLNEFSTFIVAGTDTTSHYFTMIAYYVSLYPQIQKQLRSQIAEFIKCDKDITQQNLKKLTYIDWIQNQTTRHYGPVNGIFFRTAIVDNYILNIPIRKETLTCTQPMGNHYNSQYFKDPQVFRPQRWEKECDNLPPYVFIGFSGGPRSCIGKQLALLQSKIALVKLILRYKQLVLPNPKITLSFELLYEPSHFQILFTKSKRDQ